MLRREGDYEAPERLTRWLEMPIFLGWPEKGSANRPPLERPSRLLNGLNKLLFWVFCFRS
jgi:hypothetical protein